MTQYGGRKKLARSRKCKILVVVALFTYAAITIYAIHNLVISDRSSKSPLQAEVGSNLPFIDVEVWGKAAIGLYLWEHILEGPLESRHGGAWSYGEKQLGRVRFKFRTGPGIITDRVPRDTKNLVLVLNGREPKKIQFAKAWLDSLDSLGKLENLAVVLLGSERCDNKWFLWYMQNRGGPAKVAFTVYDIPYRDNRMFYQWPLGVATYRAFPNVPMLSVDTEKPRKYRCNFLGTVYHPSSRETLVEVVNQHQLHNECYIKARNEWLPQETAESMQEFHDALRESDLTLCPVGVNTECYRIYEACSFGSVPVIEDVMTPGECSSPLSLLKTYRAPFIFIKNWNELPAILKKEKLLTQKELSKRRKTILKWYRDFKLKVRDKFVDIIEETFSA